MTGNPAFRSSENFPVSSNRLLPQHLPRIHHAFRVHLALRGAQDRHADLALEGLLEVTWGLLEVSWGILEASWAILGRLGGILEAS